HPRLTCVAKTWMRGTSPRMTIYLHPLHFNGADSVKGKSNLDLPAQLDHAAGRNAEELGRRLRVAMHHLEHRDPEALPARPADRMDAQAADEERHVHPVELQLAFAAHVEGKRYVGIFHEAVARRQGEEVVTEVLDLQPV